ncbi:MAG: T9SS type A sorting domain-containing protein, partial [Bacteroidetes bacterium]|nr:T9SS type A sorting domain-containing protein [Bacteroidota bacterium]
GNLVLDNCHLSIDVAGISGGGSSSYVITDGTSYFSEGIASTGSYTFHVGDATNYTPFTITINSATFSGSDSLTLNVQASKHPNMGTGDHIKRYWTVDAGGFTALNYDVSYIYVDGDISGTEANLKSGSWDGSNWTQYFMVNAAANTLFSVGGITTIPTGFAFSGGSAAALPIELLNFEANVVRDMIRISWSTGSELNNDFFTIQRSIDGIEFEEIAQISGAGNSISTIHYEVLDTNAPYGLIYYRLKQTDYNGEFKLYPVVSVQYDYDIPFKVYPNPAFTTDKINIEFNQSSNATSINQPEELLVVLYDQMGRLVYSKIALIENDQINMAIDLNNMLSPGVYFIIGSSDNELHKQKLVIQ